MPQTGIFIFGQAGQLLSERNLSVLWHFFWKEKDHFPVKFMQERSWES